MSHIFIEEGDKDAAKEAFGYTAVPFYIIFDRVSSACPVHKLPTHLQYMKLI